MSIRTLIVLAALFSLTMPALAAFNPGVDPYGDVTGTGAVVYSPGSLATAWHDQSVYFGAYDFITSGPLTYTETWAPATNVQTVFLDNIRPAGGDINVSTTSGGPVTTPAGTFSMAANTLDIVNLTHTTNYGVSVQVNSTTDPTYYQMGEIELLTTNPGVNLAELGTDLASPGSAGTGSVIDQQTGTYWRASTSTSENYVGYTYPSGTNMLTRAIRVESDPFDGAPFGWSDYDVQVLQNGVWNDLGQVDVTGDYYWIDFGSLIPVDGVRLYGSTADGNNPTGSGGLIVNDIQAFGMVPEPTSLGLLGMGAVILLRRRRA